MKKDFFTSSIGIIVIGAVIGAIAAWLSVMGNPANMGICIACFTRDLAGALGLHRAAAVQYIRPELIGLVIGATISALISKEFVPKGGSSPIIRFCLGFFAMIGALVFLGCPWRTLLRVAGGDINGIFGLIGIIIGGGIGVFFWKQNFSLGQPKAYKNKLVGFLPLVIAVILLILLLKQTKFSEGGPIFFSESGPGSMKAPIAIALIASIVIGFVAQKSRFCTVGGLRDGIFMKDFHMTKGVIAFIVAAFIVNIATSRFNLSMENQPIAHTINLSMENQPIAHTNILWNTVSMILTGLAFTLGAGCPGRQMIQSAEGNMDSFIFVIGMLVGAGFAHNFNLASSTAGPTVYGMGAVILGLIFCVIIGFTMKENTAS